MTEYRWKIGSRIVRVKAQDAGETIERIRKRSGVIDPDDIVSAARNKSCPLYPAFDWNLRRAAEAHWRERARYIIRSLEVVRIDEITCPPKTRGFVSLTFDNDLEDRSFRTMKSAMSSPEYRRQLLRQAMEEIELWRNKYESLEELAGLFSAIGKAKVKV